MCPIWPCDFHTQKVTCDFSWVKGLPCGLENGRLSDRYRIETDTGCIVSNHIGYCCINRYYVHHCRCINCWRVALHTMISRERTIRARTDTIRYEYSSIRDGRYRYEYSVRWCPSHLYHYTRKVGRMQLFYAMGGTLHPRLNMQTISNTRKWKPSQHY